jgi:hypothetical protein
MSEKPQKTPDNNILYSIDKHFELTEKEGYEYKERKEYYGSKPKYGEFLLKLARRAILERNPYILRFLIKNHTIWKIVKKACRQNKRSITFREKL